jgi:parallel beta helix pectate lyase-like protein
METVLSISIKPARAETHRLLAPNGREIMNADSNRRYNRTHSGLGGMLGSLFVLVATSTALAQDAQEKPRVVNVDCTQGETISRAFTRGNENRPLLVLVRGTCNESVLIDRNDVTLRGETGFGGGIAGPDPSVDTVTVTASRVAIEDLTIAGGRNGISAVGAAGMNVRNATVQSTGRTGVAFLSGASGAIDGSTIRLNARDGVAVNAAAATVRNSTISQNSRVGVTVIQGGAAFIGTDTTLLPAGNTISQNGGTGISVSNGATATIAMNRIDSNGADPSSTSGRSGVGITRATADIAGGNVISGNAGQGISAVSSSVSIGNPAFSFSSVNTITNNGDLASPGGGGIFAFVGSSVVIRDAVISANKGFGLLYSVRSQGQLFSSTIQNNAGDGIRLLLGSGLFLTPPNTTVTGNAGWGLQCADGESSVVNTGLLTLSGNSLGGVSGSCTGF